MHTPQKNIASETLKSVPVVCNDKNWAKFMIKEEEESNLKHLNKSRMP